MNTVTKLALFFLGTALVPSVLALVVLLLVGKGALWGFLILITSLVVAGALSFIVSKLISEPLKNLIKIV